MSRLVVPGERERHSLTIHMAHADGVRTLSPSTRSPSTSRSGTITHKPVNQSELDRLLATGVLQHRRIPPDCRLVEAEGLQVTDCIFDGASLRHGTLSGAVFKDCTFNASSFRSADCSDAVFERCRMYDPDKDSACDFSYADLRRARFQACELTTVTFSRIRAWGLELVNCQASGADFKQADFTLDRGNFPSAKFDACNLAYADLSDTILTGCSLSGSRLVHASCRNTHLGNADLSGCALDNMDAQGAVLTGIDLRGATFNNLDPRTCDLTGARIDPDQGLLILRALGILLE